MIAIATGRKELDENLKQQLEDSYLVDSMEFLLANLNSFDTAILSKHIKGTSVLISELLFLLKQAEVRVIYITDGNDADEIKTCIKLGIKDIVTESVSLYEVKRMVESTANSYSNRLYIDSDKDIKNSLYEFYEDAYRNETAQEFENDMYSFDNGLYENEEVEEAEAIEEVVAEKENNEAEVVKSSNTSNLNNNTVTLPNLQAVKKENIFVFTLNYVYKLLSLFINLITVIFESLQWIVISVILTAVSYYIFMNEKIDSFDSLLKLIKGYFN